ncbi:MAG: OsmC family protein [Lysobacterales bacterium]
MSEASFSITIEQESDYAFRVIFDDANLPDLHTDEPAPLGGDSGPNPSRLLLAAVANCLSASLLFALRKFHNAPGRLVTHATATMGRNAERRLRVERIEATVTLPDEPASYQQLDRILAQFEQFCVVTESVRHGVEIEVNVVGPEGQRLHPSA